jgi:hypothetical protein
MPILLLVLAVLSVGCAAPTPDYQLVAIAAALAFALGLRVGVVWVARVLVAFALLAPSRTSAESLRLDVPTLGPMAEHHRLAPRPGRTLFHLSLAAAAGDVGSSYWAFSRGYVEINPAMRGATESPISAAAVKLTSALVLEAAARVLEQRVHRRAGLAVRFFAIAAPSVATMVNVRNAANPIRAHKAR